MYPDAEPMKQRHSRRHRYPTRRQLRAGSCGRVEVVFGNDVFVHLRAFHFNPCAECKVSREIQLRWIAEIHAVICAVELQRFILSPVAVGCWLGSGNNAVQTVAAIVDGISSVEVLIADERAIVGRRRREVGAY